MFVYELPKTSRQQVSRLYHRAGEVANPTDVLPDLVLELGDSKVGNLPKDKATGRLADEWNKALVL